MTAIEHTARHEAGHAVVSHVLGVRVDSVTVQPDGDTLGLTSHAGTIADEVVEALLELRPHQIVDFGSVRRGAAIAVAGALAAGDLVGSSSDMERAERLARCAHGGDAKLGALFINYVVRFADAIVTAHQRQIDAVAAALLERRTLDGNEFRAVFDAASEGPT